VVLYLGGMERNRGAQLMVEAFHQVWKEVPQARLLHVGHFAPPDLEAEVRAALAQRNLEQAVTLAGRVPFEQIGGYLQRAAVGWVTWQPEPKNEKNIPTKLFEYMAYGLPVVCSDLASTRPFISDGENGYLVMAGDPAAHAGAILELLRNPEAAVAMGQRGQRSVQTEYNWGKMEPRLLAVYQEVLS
jgi:glycosyltransferase involved in cell wall biosynthesis